MFTISERTKELILEIEKDGDNKVTEKNVMTWIEDSFSRLSKLEMETVAMYLVRHGNDLKTLLEAYSYIDEKINQ